MNGALELIPHACGDTVHQKLGTTGLSLYELHSSEGTFAYPFLTLEVSPLAPASSFFFPPQQLFTVRSMLVFLFYSILLFSQVRYINYSSISSFQSFSLHILPSKVPISQQGFKTRCSPRRDNMGCTHCKTIVYSFPSRV